MLESMVHDEIVAHGLADRIDRGLRSRQRYSSQGVSSGVHAIPISSVFKNTAPKENAAAEASTARRPRQIQSTLARTLRAWASERHDGPAVRTPAR